MYWLCYNNNDPRAALILYAAVAPDDYDNVYGYDNRQDALDALKDAQADWSE